MNASLSFDLPTGGCVRQLDLEGNRPILAALGGRCAEYLRHALGDKPAAGDVPQLFLKMLVPQRVPRERSFVLGIFPGAGEGRPTSHLAGVLYFLHPEHDPRTWYITLLLLEPEARGQGLGAAVHTAFARWAAARGAQRLVVAVAEDNVRALRFWREHLGYAEGDASAWQQPGAPVRKNRDLERWLTPASAPWRSLSAA